VRYEPERTHPYHRDAPGMDPRERPSDIGEPCKAALWLTEGEMNGQPDV
jgi:hypothetical protein